MGFRFISHIVHSSMNNMKSKEESQKATFLKVYYDGLCKVCSGEINHYRKQRGSEQIQFIDICAPGFDARAEGVDPVAVHQVMHVKRSDGNLATRVDAFIEIWSALPKYRWLAQVARTRVARYGLDAGYSIFTKMRPLLPRYARAEDCKDSPYCSPKY